jgi:hypothetical protein
MAAMTTESTTILIEIFPLLLYERRLWILQPSEVAPDYTWLIHHQSGVHPSEIVQDQGAALLGRAWCPDSTIVHSTSWRYETDGPVARTDQLIVTYVIIVQPQPEHAQSLLAGSQLRARSFYRGDLVFADPLEAPAIISAANVLAHAIEHLALLALRDPPIAQTLSVEWHTFLADKEPQPAGELISPTQQ